MLVQPLLRNRIKVQVGTLLGGTFQEFITELQYRLHGPMGFMSLRDTHDAGCDGIIVSEQCLVACYGPTNAKFPAQKSKISGDYALYMTHWKKHLPNWRLFINLEPGPEHLKLGEALHGTNAVVWGPKRFLSLIDGLNFGHVRDLCRLLQIDEDDVGRDFVKHILDSLLKLPKASCSVDYRRDAPDLERKVRHNFPAQSITNALRLIEMTIEQQMAVSDAIGLLDDNDTKTLKTRILSDFDQAAGADFEAKFKALTRQYGQQYNRGRDDEVASYVSALLWHVFGQCLIGDEPPPLSSDV